MNTEQRKEIIMSLLPNLCEVLNENENESQNTKYIKYFTDQIVELYQKTKDSNLLFSMLNITIDIPSKYSYYKDNIIDIIIKEGEMYNYLRHFIETTNFESEHIISLCIQLLDKENGEEAS